MRNAILAVLALGAVGVIPAVAQEAASAGRGNAQPAGPAPRLPNIPYLGANAGKPDLGGKGMWDLKRIFDMGAREPEIEKPQDVPLNAKGKAIYQARLANLQKEDPEARCMPPGIPRMLYTPYPAQIMQLSDRVVFIYEGGAHIWRVIWLDGREHPKDLNPTWLGDSIGHWEGDTLMVDVVGLNDRTWLDNSGHPHGDKLHVVEKFSRPDANTLHYEATIDDPDYYTRPWTVPLNIKWAAGQELLEYICQENNKDVEHLVGK
jgi:hypothetical protein